MIPNLLIGAWYACLRHAF